eukprot:TRINITY_DN31839_c0_g1_i1.p1 TRINITY_DN31839_c0_g1~~TRINITY_DN31839_c0_g1_i1.p1  ORF type:complete len:190 (+),score=11.71 TRINITY_DN31839_c0_g1_i1:40-609(+)
MTGSRTCKICYRIVYPGIYVVGFTFLLLYFLIDQVSYVIRTKNDRECNVLSVEPILCTESGLTQHGYNLIVEVTDSQCGVLNIEACPDDWDITENATIPCYLDGCDLSFNVPSITYVTCYIAVLSCFLCYMTLTPIFAVVEFKKISNGDLEEEQHSVANSDLNTNPLEADPVQEQPVNPIPEAFSSEAV